MRKKCHKIGEDFLNDPSWSLLALSSDNMISDAFTHAGHLFSAATLSETSLCEITPTSLPLAFTTPTARTCFSSQILRGLMDTRVFGDRKNFLAGPDELRHFHWTFRETVWRDIRPNPLEIAR